MGLQLLLPNALPGMKAAIPHHVWVSELDAESEIPKRNEKGEISFERVGGITATMVDIIKAVKSQGIFMVHVVDGIETINLRPQGMGPGTWTRRNGHSRIGPSGH